MKTEETELILRAYSILSDLTPLKSDCGRLCGAACCKGDDETGMLLFPGEKELFENNPDYTVLPTDYGYDLAVCKGVCDRASRPLSCRIFPLAIVAKNSIVKVIPDPRCRAMCPLWRQAVSKRLDPGFTKAVKEVARLFSANSEMIAFAAKTSELCDEFSGL